MRIAFIVRSPPKKLGSLEDWLLGVAAEARRRGHALDVFTLQPVHPVVRARLDALGAGSSSIEELVAAPAAAVRRLARYDLLHANMLQPRSLAALICYAAWPAKIVVVDHGSVLEADASARPPLALRLRSGLSRALDRVTLARVDEVVGVSEYVRRRNEVRFGLDRQHTRAIHNGVDPSRFSTGKVPGPRGTVRLLCVAQLIPEKGIDVLLRALPLLRTQDFALRIVGFGRMEEAYRTLARALGLADRVSFLGMRDDVHLLVREADLFVHPAVWQEAFGLTVAEGMASGCGVIATRTGGIPEIIEDGRDGLLVPPGDPVALAAAIDRLASDPALRARLGAEARRKVERAFSLSRCIREHVDCMEEVGLERHPAAETSTFPPSGRTPPAPDPDSPAR